MLTDKGSSGEGANQAITSQQLLLPATKFLGNKLKSIKNFFANSFQLRQKQDETLIWTDNVHELVSLTPIKTTN